VRNRGRPLAKFFQEKIFRFFGRSDQKRRGGLAALVRVLSAARQELWEAMVKHELVWSGF
jgi:hypothetical protein